MSPRRAVGGSATAVAVLAFVLALPVAVGGSEPVWQPLADAPAPARQEVSYVALGGKLYLAAGNYRDQDRYDPATGKWTSVAPLPAAFEGVDHVHGVAVGDKILYIGGLLEWRQPFPVSAAVAVYDPASDSFTLGKEMPSPRAAGGVAAWNGMAIYAGGLGPDGSVARVDAYDPEAEEWTRLEDMPRPRDHFQAAIVAGTLYAVGGRETDEDGHTEDIAAVDALALPDEAADLATATWDGGVTSLPTSRGGLGVAAVGNCIYATGGETTTGDDAVTGATEAYDTVGDTWYPLEPLWTPRHGIQAATVGSTIYVAAGGAEPFASKPTSRHEALDVSGHAPCGVAEEPEEPEGPGEEPEEPEGPEEPEAPGEEPEEPEGTGGEAGTPAGDPPEARSPLPIAATAAPTPRLSIARLAVRPRRLRPRASRPPAARIVLRLSAPARVSFLVQRASPGLRAGARCRRAPSRAGEPSARRCTAWIERWRRVRARPRGRSVLHLQAGDRGSPLPAGRYRAVAVARGLGSDRAVAWAGFRILR